LGHAVTGQCAENARKDNGVKWFEVRAHDVFPLNEADRRAKTELLCFDVSLTLSLSGPCIGAVTRSYVFVKFLQDVCF
jgi:hypothetical protein